MPTKHKMTKAEAIACFEKHMPLASNANKTIDFFVEAGMLEIVEEKGLTLPHRIAIKLNLSSHAVAGVINELDKEGRLVRK